MGFVISVFVVVTLVVAIVGEFHMPQAMLILFNLI